MDDQQSITLEAVKQQLFTMLGSTDLDGMARVEAAKLPLIMLGDDSPGKASRNFLVFLSFQFLEKCFEQPRMTGRRDNAVLARPVDALDKRTGQTKLDELGSDPLPFLMIGGHRTALLDQGFNAAIVSGRRFLGFRLRFAS